MSLTIKPSEAEEIVRIESALRALSERGAVLRQNKRRIIERARMRMKRELVREGAE